jgi:hypothetical protein
MHPLKKEYFSQQVSAAPLALFRIIFGLMLTGGIIRFWWNGWIKDLYISPEYYFPFYGFDFVVPLGQYTYWLFAVCGLSAFFLAIGFYYRISAILLFLSFTYIELIDKSTYLNHYYFVSMVCLLMIFLPAHVYYSFDCRRNKDLLADRIPLWMQDALKLMVCILYFYAGIAKINSDWLLHALPLRIWLPARNDIPLIGFLFNFNWIHYFFSWAGCIYDLSIPFLLWNRRTTTIAYILVVVFHGLTSLLFPIGMFPYIMIVTALIFFPADLHLQIFTAINKWLKLPTEYIYPDKFYNLNRKVNIPLRIFVSLFLTFHLIFPFRFILYPGKLFWTEQGFRFSWRVMLIEKAGYAQFTVKDPDGKYQIVNNSQFLTPLQEKMMATQPDMILQYAHILKDYYSKNGFTNPEVYVDSYVSLNGRFGKPLIDPSVNLALEEESFSHKSWIKLY